MNQSRQTSGCAHEIVLGLLCAAKEVQRIVSEDGIAVRSDPESIGRQRIISGLKRSIALNECIARRF